MKTKIAQYGICPDPDQGKLIVGVKQLRKALAAGRAMDVFLAENADPAITDAIAQLCRQNQIQITWVPSMSELGRACGIEVGAAAAAVVR